MKITLVIDDRISRPGGIQEYVLGLYDFLKKNGHRPLILTTGRYSEKSKEGRRIIGVGRPIEFLGNDAQKAFPLIFGQQERIKRILNQEKPDILHIQGFPGTLSLACLRFSQLPNVMTYHVVSYSGLAEDLGKHIFRLWKKDIDKIHGKIAISKIAASSAQKFIPGPYKIIPIGIDLSRFNLRVPPISKFKDGKTNILFVGRLDKRKGIDYLLSAFVLVSERLPNVRLIIVGRGPEERQAKNFVRKNGLAKKVTFVGKVSREALPSYYATADIFCSPATHGESFGVVLLEAMASGLPVVAFDNSGYRTLFPMYAQEFLVFNRSSPALAQALLILATNSSLRKSQAQKNYQYAQQFSWEKVGGEIVKYYQRLLKKN